MLNLLQLLDSQISPEEFLDEGLGRKQRRMSMALAHRALTRSQLNAIFAKLRMFHSYIGNIHKASAHVDFNQLHPEVSARLVRRLANIKVSGGVVDATRASNFAKTGAKKFRHDGKTQFTKGAQEVLAKAGVKIISDPKQAPGVRRIPTELVKDLFKKTGRLKPADIKRVVDKRTVKEKRIPSFGKLPFQGLKATELRKKISEVEKQMRSTSSNARQKTLSARSLALQGVLRSVAKPKAYQPPPTFGKKGFTKLPSGDEPKFPYTKTFTPNGVLFVKSPQLKFGTHEHLPDRIQETPEGFMQMWKVPHRIVHRTKSGKVYTPQAVDQTITSSDLMLKYPKGYGPSYTPKLTAAQKKAADKYNAALAKRKSYPSIERRKS